jgi:folate-binding protein YgfZ
VRSAEENAAVSAAYRAAREGLAHRLRETATLDVEGPDREAFLQGQLTQEVRGLKSGEARAAAALTPKGKLLFVARLVGLPDRFRLLLPACARATALEHLRKYAAFQKVDIADRSDELRRVGLYGPRAERLSVPLGDADRVSGEGEFGSEILAPRQREDEIVASLQREGSIPVDERTAEVLRLEAGRPSFGRDIDGSNLPDEAGLSGAISWSKGCYVGQEIVARRRTYGRMNRRLVGFRFPEGRLSPGELLRRPERPEAAHGPESGRVTSAAVSPRLGPIGIGFAFHDVSAGERLVSQADPGRSAIVSTLPFE